MQLIEYTERVSKKPDDDTRLLLINQSPVLLEELYNLEPIVSTLDFDFLACIHLTPQKKSTATEVPELISAFK